MSARAAWRLESLGFGRVYHYPGGKEDWVENGLPTEGEEAGQPVVADAVRADVATCAPADPLEVARRRAAGGGLEVCVVVNDVRVVLGLLDGRALAGPAATAQEAMGEGPTTWRPGRPLAEVVAHLRERDLPRALVTTADGRLVGLLRRQDAEAELARRGGPAPDDGQGPEPA